MTADPAIALSIREANVDDLPAVEVLCAASLEFETHADATAFPGVLLRRDATLLVAVSEASKGGAEIVGVVFGSVHERNPDRAHLDLLAVSPGVRRRGVGRALVRELIRRAREDGRGELVVAGNPPWYCWPGVDVRYTPAICLFQSEGFERADQMMNMAAVLRGRGELLDTTDDEARLAASGVGVRRLEHDDVESIRPWLAGWGGHWEAEALGALRHDPVRCHVAHDRDGAWLGFAAWGVNAPSAFGPMGTDPASRGLGIGSVLLRRCLADQYVDRYDRAEIGWVGPYPFYSKVVGAYIDRIFWSFRLSLR